MMLKGINVMTISKAVSIRLIELLKQNDLTQYKLEQKTGISHDTIKSIMKGKAKGVNLRTIITIADGLEISVSEFLNSPLFEYNNLEID